jgi:hypothetical protein
MFKRCLVELSLKESLLHRSIIAIDHALPDVTSGMQLSLVATRVIQFEKKKIYLISCVDITIVRDGFQITSVRKNPWGDVMALQDFLEKFPFIRKHSFGQTDSKALFLDNQFFMVDNGSGAYLQILQGDFIPKILINDRYPSISSALAAQDDSFKATHLASGSHLANQRKTYAKGAEFNLLPYYMAGTETKSIGRNGGQIYLQLYDQYIRYFVPKSGCLDGTGASMIAMRDVLLYDQNGQAKSLELLDQPLVILYFHTLTNGILVGGDNSKLSILEKLARLALEN